MTRPSLLAFIIGSARSQRESARRPGFGRSWIRAADVFRIRGALGAAEPSSRTWEMPTTPLPPPYPAAAKSSPVSPPKSSPRSGSRGRPVCPRGLSQSAAVSGEMVGRAHSGSLSRATSPPEARPRQPPECVSLLAHSRRQRRRSRGLARHRRATTPKPIVRLGRSDRGCGASVGVSSVPPGTAHCESQGVTLGGQPVQNKAE